MEAFLFYPLVDVVEFRVRAGLQKRVNALRAAQFFPALVKPAKQFRLVRVGQARVYDTEYARVRVLESLFSISKCAGYAAIFR